MNIFYRYLHCVQEEVLASCPLVVLASLEKRRDPVDLTLEMLLLNHIGDPLVEAVGVVAWDLVPFPRALEPLGRGSLDGSGGESA